MLSGFVSCVLTAASTLQEAKHKWIAEHRFFLSLTFKFLLYLPSSTCKRQNTTFKEMRQPEIFSKLISCHSCIFLGSGLDPSTSGTALMYYSFSSLWCKLHPVPRITDKPLKESWLVQFKSRASLGKPPSPAHGVPSAPGRGPAFSSFSIGRKCSVSKICRYGILASPS